MTSRVGRRLRCLALLFVGLLAVACGDDDAPSEAPSRRDPPTVGVGLVTTTVDAGLDVGGGIELQVYYPSRIEPGQPVREGAAPAVAGGPYPLVVFVHGAGAQPDYYYGLLDALAAQGYVVAAPAFPTSSSPDVVGSNQAPALARSQALALPALVERVTSSAIEGVPVPSLVDPEHVHLVGHSLGGATHLAAAFNSCCQLTGLDSVTVIAGVLVDVGGDYGLEGTPLVLVHGAEDSVIPIDTAEQIYSQATGPKYFLRVAGVGHNDVVAPTSAPFGVVTRAIGAVLEWTSQGESPEEALLAATEDEPAVSLEADP